jgi:hypothetical protein
LKPGHRGPHRDGVSETQSKQLIDVDFLEGRDLDAAIAEHVLGWKPFKVGPDAKGEHRCEILAPHGELPKGYQLPNLGTLHRGFLAPEFHRRLDQAIQLAQRFGRKRIEIDGDLRHMPTLISRSILREQLANVSTESISPTE